MTFLHVIDFYNRWSSNKFTYPETSTVSGDYLSKSMDVLFSQETETLTVEKGLFDVLVT